MWNKIRQIWKIPDLRKDILFVLAMLALFRFLAHVPLPGVDSESLKDFFQSNAILGLINIFSGGAMENFSVVMLGVAPYITASIIFQLLVMIVPRLEEIQKEGEAGQKKISQYTRFLTVPLAILQAYAMISLFRQGGQNIITNTSAFALVSTVIAATAGTVFLMWIGELISERKVGNGISLLIFAGIIAGMPSYIRQTMVSYDPTQLLTIVALLVIGVVTVAGIVFITEGQRKVPVSYARRIRGMRQYGGVNTYLPLKVNQAGVIPIIFAIALLLIPPMVAQFFAGSGNAFIAGAAQFIVDLFQNQIFYAGFYFSLVVAFTYFYTSVVFHPQQIAENLQKQGGFIPGIRPGPNTSTYLTNVSNRIMLAGALFLGSIAIMPIVLQAFTGMQSVVMIGGTSILILVSVVIETIKQVESQVTMREYDG